MVKRPISDSKTPLYLIFQVPMKPKKVVPEAKVPAPKKEVAAAIRGTSYCLLWCVVRLLCCRIHVQFYV